MDFPVDLPDHLKALALKLGIRAEDIDEFFTRGGGPGGQKINKTASCVELTHRPTGTVVRVQQFREQSRNRVAAYETLILKIDETVRGKESQRAQEKFQIRKQKQRRSRRAKEKILKDKHHRGSIKEDRIRALHESME